MWFAQPVTSFMVKEARQSEELELKRKLEGALGMARGWRKIGRIRCTEWFPNSECITEIIASAGFSDHAQVIGDNPGRPKGLSDKWLRELNDMRTMRSSGDSLQKIGDKYGICRERVRQILDQGRLGEERPSVFRRREARQKYARNKRAARSIEDGTKGTADTDNAFYLA
jgi:hypothetical protein